MSPNLDLAGVGEVPPVTVDKFTSRVIRTSSLGFINMLQGWGAILLLPALFRENNQDLDLIAENNDCTLNVIHGTQFLLIALVTGGANIMGRMSGYLLSGKANFRALQSSLAIIIAISYGIMIFKSELVVTVVAMGIIKLTFSMMILEITLICFDPFYFGYKRLNTASSIIFASGACGAVVGNSFAAFLKPQLAIWLNFMFSVIQIGIAFSFSDK